MKILLSAYACDPTKGSEPNNGFNWALGLAEKGYEVHCLTREINKEGIGTSNNSKSIFFHYIKLPFKLEFLYRFSQPTMYLHYIIWQWLAYKKGKMLLKNNDFQIAHHVTFGSLQLGSFLYKLGIPLIFGPAGGGQVAPIAFQKYFSNHWLTERKRELISYILIRWNPACKKMIKNTAVAIATNTDTLKLFKKIGAKKVELILDAALPEDFFPETLPLKKLNKKELNLLWVGRFLPRKGILLIVDIMEKLKAYPYIKLTVVGDGEMREDFLSAVENYELNSNINWIGRVEYSEVKSIYSKHDAFLFTSLRDSSPAQLIEAMAYGLPVITLNLHGQGLMIDETRGFRCDAENPEVAIQQITSAILKLYNDRVLLQELSKGAYSFSLNQTWEKKISIITNKYYK